MLRIRKILLAVALVVGLGSLGISLSYGWYLHSDTYKNRFENRVAQFLDLKVTIGGVRPLTLDSVSLLDITARLPDHGEEVFRCARAYWLEKWESHDRRFDLLLSDGRLRLGSGERTWQKPDYERVLQSGLAHNFAELNLDHVQLKNMEVQVIRPLLSLQVAGAEGSVFFKGLQGKGSAELKAEQINGYRVQAPIHISALFTPGEALSFHRVALRVPRMPVRYLRVDQLLESTISEGFFKGEIVYRDEPLRSVDFAGTAEGLSLSELTEGLSSGALSGRIKRLNIERARFEQGEFVQIIFRGRIEALAIPNVTAMLELSDVGAEVELEVSRGVVDRQGVRELDTKGKVGGINLPKLTRLADIGTISGTLDLRMHHLTMKEGRVVSAEIDATVQPPTDGFAVIDREVLLAAAKRIFEVELPALPFEELEYVNFGAKLLVNENRLRLAGLYGDGQHTILSIRLLGQEVPLIRAPDKTFDLTAVFEALRPVAEQYELPDWWKNTRNRQ